MKRDVETLAGFGTRHTLSETGSDTRGIGAARRWLKAQLEETGAVVSFDKHVVEPDGKRVTRKVDVVNVVAEVPGHMKQAAGRRYYVIGHYDSRATDPLDHKSDAPGADDDASGVAVVLELARVMAKRKWDATLVFMATAGEEQGLLGARLHAHAAKKRGATIAGVLSNDIVGDPTAPSGARHAKHVRVFSDGNDTASRQFARFVEEVGRRQKLAVQAKLVFRRDRFLRGGDHTVFDEAGFPAVRFTEVEESYRRQHQDVRAGYGDLPEFVDADYLAGVARLNAAAMAEAANAPSVPADARIIAAALTNDTTLRWSASPEPDTAGYEVLWRDTTAPTWEEHKDVGNVTEATLPLSKDNFFFGIRAYDKQGHRSPAAFPIAARE